MVLTHPMDFSRPVEALIPGAQGRVLAVLAEDRFDGWTTRGNCSLP